MTTMREANVGRLKSAGQGGRIVPAIVPEQHDKMKMHVAISAAGVFYTEDGRRSWQPRNRGTRADFLPDRHPDLGQCVHEQFPAADERRFCRTVHFGMYRKQFFPRLLRFTVHDSRTSSHPIVKSS